MFLKALLTVALLTLAGCTQPAALSQPSPDQHQITQVSIINALMLGQYDGVVTMQDLLQAGNFGLGTCDHLDGELIVLDGKAYQAKADGTVAELAPQATTPFAIVTPFNPSAKTSLGALASLNELEAHLDSLLPDQNQFLALRVEGDFSSLTLRSVPRQEPPYIPLAEAAKQQALFSLEHMRGTLVGIRSPQWVSGLSVPGYHWHFLSADRRHGGHVLNCQIRNGHIQSDLCRSWLIKLDPSRSLSDKDLSTDLSEELEQVERMRKQP